MGWAFSGMARNPGRLQRSWWQRPLRWLLALILMPVALAVSWTVWDLFRGLGSSVDFWVPIVSGAGVWLVIFASLPRPMWLYVVGHELTHALWALLFGGRVKAFKATSKGGHVVLTKTNSLITLAPYFFPLYAALWVVGFLGVGWLLGWRRHLFWFHFGLGLTYAFHLTLTAAVLRVRQPDLEGEGWIFSGVLIWLLHGILLLVALPFLAPRLAPVSVLAAMGDRMLLVLRWLVNVAGMIFPNPG